MAGIGFELHKILEQARLLKYAPRLWLCRVDQQRPWVLSIVSLALLGVVCRHMASEQQMELVFASVTYVYALSLILTGPVQMVLTRYTADQKFSHKSRKIFPAIT